MTSRFKMFIIVDNEGIHVSPVREDYKIEWGPASEGERARYVYQLSLCPSNEKLLAGLDTLIREWLMPLDGVLDGKDPEGLQTIALVSEIFERGIKVGLNMKQKGFLPTPDIV